MVRNPVIGTLLAALLLTALPLRAQVTTAQVAFAENSGNYTGLLQKLNTGAISNGASVFTGSVVEGSRTRACILSGTNILVRGGGVDLAPGDMAPGLNTTFSGFTSVFVNSAEQIAFTATTEASSGFSFWAGAPGSLLLVATDGTPAPGTNGNFSIGHPGQVLGELTAFNDAGQVALAAALDGAPNETQGGLWVGLPGALQLVARNGSQAPGFATGVTWSSLGRQGLNAAGQVAFVGSVSVAPPISTGVTTREAIAVGLPGALQIVARSGERAPGTEPSVFLALDDQVSLNAQGAVAFRSRLVLTGAQSGQSFAIYAGSAGNLQVVARRDFPAPGAESDAVFSDFDRPVINASGEVAFASFITSASRPSGRALWTGTAGRLRLVARTGDTAPDTGGLVFSNLPQDGLVLSDSGQVAFIAGFGTTANNSTGSGLFATDKAGVLRLIVRVGSSLGGYAVNEVQLTEGSNLATNGDSRRTALDAQGRLLFYAKTQVTQTDPSREALYRTSFDPSVPVIPANGQPQDVAGVVGGSATFSVLALGSRPATYQWKHNGSDITGATAATLTLTNLVAEDRGAYTVVITHGANSVTSAAAQLAFPPVNATQPLAKTVSAGATANLQVSASGPGTLTYQWQFKAAGASTFANRSTATQAMLSLSNVTTNDAGTYRVLVTNADGTTTSAEARLTVAAAGQPLLSRVFIPGDAATGIADRFTFSGGEKAVLNNAGEILFEGELTSVANSRGIYQRKADGTYRHVLFAGYNFDLGDSGDLVATLNGTGFLHGKPDALATLAQLGALAPGSSYSYNLTGGSVIDDSGTTAFRFGLSNGDGNFIGKPGNVAALALTGQQAPGLANGVLFNGLADPVINPLGTAAFFAVLSGTGITGANDTSLWTGTAGNVQRVVAEGDAVAAAGSGVKIGEIRYPSSDKSPFGWNAAGELAFQAGLTGTGVTTDNDAAILAGLPNALAVVVRTGVANGHTFSFDRPTFPLINAAGQVVFVATVVPTGQTNFLESIWLWTPGSGGGTRQLIARQGQQVPGLAAGITFDSSDIGRPVFTCSINGSGQIAFSSFIAGPGISFDNANNFATFITLPTGEVKLIARSGASIDVGGGETRTVKSLSSILQSGGEDGRARVLSEDGQVVFTAGLQKPSTLALDYGLFTARLPGMEPTVPSVTTQNPSNVSETGATLRASVNPNRGVTTVYFEYGSTTNYGQTTASQTITGGTSPVAISAAITNLTANSTYHYRVVATNSAGTVSGDDISFIATTGGSTSSAPVATISPATNLTATTATLNGSIDRKGEATSYHYEYGTTTSYGQSTTTSTSFPGTSAYPVPEPITGLTAKTLYHYRLFASSVGGSSQSADGTFTTRGVPGDFTIAITDLANGTIISPNARLLASAAVKLPRRSKTKIAAVQFYVDGVLVSTDARSAYKVEATVATPGQHTLTAVGVDTNNKEVESAPINFSVSETGAGPLALTSSLSPSGGTAAPGTLLTYTLNARNSSNTAVKNVELSLLVPVGSGYVETRFVNVSGQPIATPKGVTISFNGANGTVTVKFKDVKAFAAFSLQLLARVPFDQTTTGNTIASSAFTIKATQVRDNFTANFPTRSIAVVGTLPPGTAKPILGLFVSQSAAGELPSDPSIVTVTKADRRLGVPGEKRTRTSNEIVYRIHFANYGNAPAHSVRVIAPIPPGTTFDAKSTAIITARGDSVAVAPPVQFGNLLFFDVPSLEGGYLSGTVGSSKTLYYTVSMDADREIGDTIEHLGASVTSGELLIPAVTNVRKVARVVAPEQMTYSFTKIYEKRPDQPVDSATGTVYHTIFYANQGGLAAKDVGVRYTIPAGLAFQSARFLNGVGAPIVTPRTQSIATPNAGATSGNVTFSIGAVGAAKRGAVQVILKLDPASRPAQVLKIQSTYVGYDSTTAAPAARSLRAANTRVNTPSGSQPNQTGTITQQAYDPTLARLFVMQSTVVSASVLSEFDVLLTWGNLSATTSGSGTMRFPIPAGTEYVNASDTVPSFGSQTITASVNGPSTQFPNGLVAWTLGPVANSSLTATIRLRVKAGVTGQIQLNEASGSFDQSIGPVFCAPLAIRVIPAGLSVDEQRTEIHSTAFGQGSEIATGTAAAPVAKFVDNVKSISGGSRAISIAGADYAHLSEAGGVVIPIGNGRMVAAGGGNFVDQSTASMVAAGGGNLVAAGGGNMKVAVTASTFQTGTQLISNAPTLVAAGGLNLVAAGGLNLLHKLVGNDGASLIGIDGSTLIGLDGSTLGSFKQPPGGPASFTPANASTAVQLSNTLASMVAAGGGNLRIAGGGHVAIAGGANLLPPAALVGLDGGTVIARNGTNLIGDNSAGLINKDGNTLIGNDGSTLVTASGGNFVTGGTGMVAAGGLNNQ